MSTAARARFTSIMALVSTLFCAAASHAADTQNNNSLVTRLMPQTFFSMTNWIGSEVQNNSASSHFGGGVTVDIGSSQFVIETGVAFQQEGTQLNIPDSSPITFTLNYLTIPVFAKYYFDEPQRSTPYIKAGVATAFLIGNSASDNDNNVNLDQEFSSYDLQAIGAAGYLFKISSGFGVLLEASYMRGLLNVISPSSVLFGGHAAYNSAVTGALGVAIDL